jgi:glycosyltransferase involved in cell wall biosynthesis
LKILIISDAWRPQINGVVRTLEATVEELARLGHETRVLGPMQRGRRVVAVPFYPEVKLEFFAYRRVARVFDEFGPDLVHIATEGPLGWAARRLCLRQKRPFTTSYHTRFPEYLAAFSPAFLGGVARSLVYSVLRWFHAPAEAVMVATASLERDLKARGFSRLARCSRGVDANLFRPRGEAFPAYASLPRPVLLYVGRIAGEKNLPAFLDIANAGSRVVIGDGPDLASLKSRYPEAHFLGAIAGEDLARHYAAADLFVFPSTTDTFGLVLLEACAAGLRIAAKPAPGPADIFADAAAKDFVALDWDLGRAVAAALRLPDTPDAPRAFAKRFSWEACTRQFLAHLQTPVRVERPERVAPEPSEHAPGVALGD